MSDQHKGKCCGMCLWDGVDGACCCKAERIQREEVSKCPRCGTAATYQLGENSFGCKCTYEAETGAAVILHWCEVCGKEEELTSEAGYEAGWDFPPKMGKVGWVCPRTCPDCTIEKTAWFALQRGQDLTKKQEKAVARMMQEPEEQE